MLKRFFMQAMFVFALITFTSALFVFATTRVGAQAAPLEKDSPRGPRPPRIEELLNLLRLTAAQTTTVQNLLSAERTAMHAIEASHRPQRDAIHSNTRKELAATLTPEQLKRYDEWREANRPPRQPADAGRQAEWTSNDRLNPTR